MNGMVEPLIDARRILLIRLSSLGDVVLTSPAIRAVRRAYPKASISMLVGKRSAEVVQHNPHLDEVIPFDRKGQGRNTSEMARVIGRLRERPFDLSFDLQRKFRTALLAWGSGIRHRVGDHEGGGFLCTHRVQEPSEGHAVERYLGLLDAVGIAADGLRTELFVSEAEQAFAGKTLAPEAGVRLGLFPGAGWELREWMPARFAAIGDRVVEEYGAEVVLFGGPAEVELAHRIAGAMSHPATVLAGTLSVGQLAALIQRCDLFLSNDTGPMHMAVAVGTPTIALFGPGDHLKFGPLGEEHALIRHAVPCSPCKQFTDRCKDNICMKRITVDEVWRAIRKRLDRR